MLGKIQEKSENSPKGMDENKIITQLWLQVLELKLHHICGKLVVIPTSMLFSIFFFNDCCYVVVTKSNVLITSSFADTRESCTYSCCVF